MAKLAEYLLMERIKLSILLSSEMQGRQVSKLDEMIEIGHRAWSKKPDEWILNYYLCDQYQGNGNYPEALEMSRNCVEIRPNDIRSTYAHATSYNLLARASWNEIDFGKFDMIQKIIRSDRIYSTKDVFDPSLAQGAIDRTGISLEIAAIQAIRWFERSLSLNPDSSSREQIKNDLFILFHRFPQLK